MRGPHCMGCGIPITCDAADLLHQFCNSIFIDDFLALGGKQRVHDAAAAREGWRGREGERQRSLPTLRQLP